MLKVIKDSPISPDLLDALILILYVCILFLIFN